MARDHSRYPVIDDEDVPVGVVHLIDVLKCLESGRTGETAATVMRPATVLRTLMPLPDALQCLIDTRTQLACVSDEYGGMEGVVCRGEQGRENVGESTDGHDVGGAIGV